MNSITSLRGYDITHKTHFKRLKRGSSLSGCSRNYLRPSILWIMLLSLKNCIIMVSEVLPYSGSKAICTKENSMLHIMIYPHLLRLLNMGSPRDQFWALFYFWYILMTYTMSVRILFRFNSLMTVTFSLEAQIPLSWSKILTSNWKTFRLR